MTRPYILIVEDDQWLAEQYIQTLTEVGLNADCSPDAVTAMEVIDKKRPDILVLDVFLPGPNAFVLLHELQSHADLAHIPVILCTNSADRLAQEDIGMYGVRRILDKTTMLPSDLVTAVRKVMV